MAEDARSRGLAAWALYRKGQHIEALRAIDEAAALAPGEPRLLDLKCEILLGAGRAREALDAARAAMRPSPLRPDGLYNVGRAEWFSGDRAEALRTAETLREVAPGEARSHELCGFVLEGMGRAREAIVAYHRALVLTPAGAATAGQTAPPRDDEVEKHLHGLIGHHAAGRIGVVLLVSWLAALGSRFAPDAFALALRVPFVVTLGASVLFVRHRLRALPPEISELFLHRRRPLLRALMWALLALGLGAAVLFNLLWLGSAR